MKVVISSGHGKYIRGASGSPVPPQLDEVDEARKVVDQVAAVLRSTGVETITFHDDTSHDQSTNLSAIVNFHNKQNRDFDISVHFNAYDGKAHGCEVLYKTQEDLANTIVDKICMSSGLTNRGPKYRSDLKFLNSTEMPAVLVEVCFCDNTPDSDIYRDKFDDICAAIAEGISGEDAGVIVPEPPESERPERPERPEPPGEEERRTLSEGDQGPDVAALQKSLGIRDDGDFGSITDTQVRAFQAAVSLDADGVVGPNTWDEVDLLSERMAKGDSGLSDKMIEDVMELAENSPVLDYAWPGRGQAPPGYIPGMCLCYALAVFWLQNDKDVAVTMAQRLGNSDKDAMTWYQDKFAEEGMNNDLPTDRLRHLFVLLTGLGMRESSGQYFEGRDMSASNVEADTCEAGLFQSSWNFHNASDYIEELFNEYWDDPNGFLTTFNDGISPSASDLDCYGTGDGAAYQWLAKFSPAFAVMTTAVGLRVIRQHWGPINRHEVTIDPALDELLYEVQQLVEDEGRPETS